MSTMTLLGTDQTGLCYLCCDWVWDTGARDTAWCFPPSTCTNGVSCDWSEACVLPLGEHTFYAGIT